MNHRSELKRIRELADDLGEDRMYPIRVFRWSFDEADSDEPGTIPIPDPPPGKPRLKPDQVDDFIARHFRNGRAVTGLASTGTKMTGGLPDAEEDPHRDA